MNVMMFRAKAKPEHVDNLEAAVKTMFAALNVQQPVGVKYASSRLGDSTTYIILLALENPVENPSTRHLRVPGISGEYPSLAGRTNRS